MGLQKQSLESGLAFFFLMGIKGGASIHQKKTKGARARGHGDLLCMMAANLTHTVDRLEKDISRPNFSNPLIIWAAGPGCVI